MSDTTSPNDTAIEAIDRQVRQLDEAIEAGTRRVAIDTGIRAGLLEVRAALSPKVRTRKPRVVEVEKVEGFEVGVRFGEMPPPLAPNGWTGFNAPPPPEAA